MLNPLGMNTQTPIDIGIASDDRRHIVEGLYRILADTYTLYLKTQNFRWNVTGPLFYSLQILFEKQYKEMADAVDTIAERIRALGFPAPGSYREFMRLNSVLESESIPTATEMIRLLVTDNETVILNARSLLREAQAVQDPTTVDLLTHRIEIHEQNAWMLNTHLQR